MIYFSRSDLDGAIARTIRELVSAPAPSLAAEVKAKVLEGGRMLLCGACVYSQASIDQAIRWVAPAPLPQFSGTELGCTWPADGTAVWCAP